MINVLLGLLRAVGFVWALPATLAGLLVAWLYCRPRGLRFRGRVLEVDAERVPGGMGAVTLGHVQLYARRPSPRLRAHEDVHTLQCDLLGPLMLLYFVFFGVLWVAWFVRSGGSATVAYWLAYHDNPFEIWARVWSRRA